MFHWCEWQLWGHQADYIAWRALTGQVTFSDSSLAAWEDGTKRGGHTQGKVNAESGHLARITHIKTPKKDATRLRNGADAVSSGQLERARQKGREDKRRRTLALYDTICELRDGGFTYVEMCQFISTSVNNIRTCVHRQKHLCGT